MLNLNEYFTEDTENFVKNRVEYRLKELYSQYSVIVQ